MAYVNGIADNHTHLLALLADFVRNNGWSVMEQSTLQLSLKGPGTSGLDEIYCNIAIQDDPTTGRYNWQLSGAWGYRAGRDIAVQPMSSESRYLYLWNTQIPYWIIVNPRRIILLVKVSSVYQLMYLGFGLPPATDNQYPYPLIIGGCGSLATQNYSATGVNNSMFCANVGANGMINLPGGDWAGIGPSACPAITPWNNFKATLLPDEDGNYLLIPLYITDSSRAAVYTALDGIYQISGFDNAAENVISIAAVNYLVFQDVYRTGVGDYFAVRLN